MAEETKNEVETQNAEAAASELPAEAPEGNDAAASTVSESEGDGTVSLANAGAVGAGASLINEDEVIPTTGGAVPTDPLLLATIQVFRSRFDGQFFIKANTGEGYSAPNASTAGHVGGNLVAAIVQESINSKFEYAAGAA